MPHTVYGEGSLSTVLTEDVFFYDKIVREVHVCFTEHY